MSFSLYLPGVAVHTSIKAGRRRRGNHRKAMGGTARIEILTTVVSFCAQPPYTPFFLIGSGSD